jgi:hypothetical protein
VRTQHGLTEGFDILSSVRQGDPLAAIIFILLIDSLHAGLRNNPIHAVNADHGHSFLPAHGGYRVFSSGFADDSNLFNDSWVAAREQHLFVLDFFTAHHMRLNAKKSYCVVCSGKDITGAIKDGDPRPPGLRYLPNIVEEWVHDPMAGKPAALDVLDNPPALIGSDFLTYGTSFCFRYLGYPFRADLKSDEAITMLRGRSLRSAIGVYS